MRQIFFTSLLIISVFSNGCVKRQLERIASNITSNVSEKDIRFSYEVKNEYSTEYFGMIGCVIENVTNKWITIDSIEITSDEEQKSNMSIVGGSDIYTWFASMSVAKRIESANKQMLWGTISLTATLGGAMSKDANTQKLAGLTSVAAGTIFTLEQFNSIKNQLKLYEYFPEDHLMRTPFRIPPGLGVDKWMVINSQVSRSDKLIKNLKLKVYYDENKTKEFVFEFITMNKKNIQRGWQSNLLNTINKLNTNQQTK